MQMCSLFFAHVKHVWSELRIVIPVDSAHKSWIYGMNQICKTRSWILVVFFKMHTPLDWSQRNPLHIS